MAEQAGIPTFKLVLVGDGGTGKVFSFSLLLRIDIDCNVNRRRLSRDILQESSRRSISLLSGLKVILIIATLVLTISPPYHVPHQLWSNLF